MFRETGSEKKNQREAGWGVGLRGCACVRERERESCKQMCRSVCVCECVLSLLSFLCLTTEWEKARQNIER